MVEKIIKAGLDGKLGPTDPEVKSKLDEVLGRPVVIVDQSGHLSPDPDEDDCYIDDYGNWVVDYTYYAKSGAPEVLLLVKEA